MVTKVTDPELLNLLSGGTPATTQQAPPTQPDIISGASPDLSQVPPEAFAEFARQQNEKEISRAVTENPFLAGAGTLGKGITFNFMDEIMGQLNNLGVGNFPTRETTQQISKEFAEQRPVTSFGLELGGNILGTLPFGEFAMGSKLAQLNPIKTTGLLAAGETGVSMAGGSTFGDDITDRLKALAAGAAFGGPLGMGGAKLGQLLINKALPAAGRMLTESFKGPVQRAKDIVKPFLDDAFPGGVDDATAKLLKLGPEANLMDVGEAPVQALGTAVAAEDLGFKNVITKQLAKRTREGIRRIDRSVRNILGTKGKEVAQTVTDISNKRFKEASPLYAQADQMSVQPSEVNGFIDVLDNQLREIQNVDINKGLVKLKKGLFNTLDDGSQQVKTSVRQLRLVRDDLTSKINKSFKNEDMAQWRLLSNWRDGLDELMPDEFLQANRIWSSSKDIDSAMTAGAKMLRVDAEDLTELMARYNDGQREAYLIGATKAIKQKMGDIADGGKVSKVFNRPNVRERLGIIIGDEGKTQKFLNEVEQENIFKATENLVLGNSATQSRQETQKIFRKRAATAPSLSKLTSKVIQSLQGAQGVPKPVLNELTGMLTEQGLTPKTLERLMKTPVGEKIIQDLIDFQGGGALSVIPGAIGAQTVEPIISSGTQTLEGLSQ